MWLLHILKGKLKRFTTSRKKRLKKIIIRMNKYVNKQKKRLQYIGLSSLYNGTSSNQTKSLEGAYSGPNVTLYNHNLHILRVFY